MKTELNPSIQKTLSVIQKKVIKSDLKKLLKIRNNIEKNIELINEMNVHTIQTLDIDFEADIKRLDETIQYLKNNL